MVMQVCDTKFILVRAKCLYIQFELLRSCTRFVVGVTNGREREQLPSLWLRARESVCVCVRERERRLDPPLRDTPLPLYSLRERGGLIQK